MYMRTQTLYPLRNYNDVVKLLYIMPTKINQLE